MKMSEKKVLLDMPFCPCRQGNKNYTQCEELITEEYYKNFCDTNRYKYCMYFARKYGLLKTSMTWFMKDAVKRDIQVDQ